MLVPRKSKLALSKGGLAEVRVATATTSPAIHRANLLALMFHKLNAILTTASDWAVCLATSEIGLDDDLRMQSLPTVRLTREIIPLHKLLIVAQRPLLMSSR